MVSGSWAAGVAMRATVATKLAHCMERVTNMAEEQAAEKPAEQTKEAGKAKKAEKKAAGPGWTARFTGWFNAAGCASCLTAIFLMLLVAGVWTYFWLEPGNIPWRHAMSWPRMVLVVLLVIAIPLVLYRAIRLWLEGEESSFPDIDFAWKSGLDALAQNGLTPTSAPLFIVLGSAGLRQETALIRAAALPLRVREVPEGPAPLHWYAGPDGIYLVLSETCGLSSLAVLLEKRRAQGRPLDEMPPAPALAVPIMRAATAVRPVTSPVAARASQPQPPGGARGTIMLDQFVADTQAAEAQAAAAAVATETEEEPEQRTVVPAASDQPAILSQQESARQRAR